MSAVLAIFSRLVEVRTPADVLIVSVFVGVLILWSYVKPCEC